MESDESNPLSEGLIGASPRGDDATLVEAPREVDDDLAGPMVVDHLELSDVAFLHHDGQEPDDHLGAGADQDLPLASLLGIVDAFQAVSQ